MAQKVVEGLATQARLDDVEQALGRARSAAGSDPEWDEFKSEVEAGDILPLVLEVSVSATDEDGDEFTVGRVNQDVWVAAPTHPPELEEAVREISSKDFGELSSDLGERGLDVSAADLGRMYIRVTLDDELRRAVLGTRAAAAD
jgi:hypothetical protein